MKSNALTLTNLLFEQHGSRKRITDFGKGIALGKKDHLIDFSKPKIKPGWMTAHQKYIELKKAA